MYPQYNNNMIKKESSFSLWIEICLFLPSYDCKSIALVKFRWGAHRTLLRKFRTNLRVKRSKESYKYLK
jgi:hypothetical protein